MDQFKAIFKKIGGKIRVQNLHNPNFNEPSNRELVINDYKGFKINIVLRSIEKLRKIAEEKKDLFQKEIFRKSEVLMDSDGEASNLLKEIDKI